MKIKALAFSLIAVVFVSGCSLTKAPAGEEMLQEGIANLYYEASSAKFDMNFIGDMKAPAGQKPERIQFDVNLSGDMDNTKPAEPKFNMVLKGGASWDEVKDQKAEVEMKSDSKYFFFILKDVSDFGGMLPAETVSAFLGKWYKMPIPPNTFEALDRKSDMTEVEKKIQELAKKTNFMKDIKSKGTKKIMGTESYVYTAKLDKEAVKNFLIEVAKLDETKPTPSESELKKLDEQLKMFEVEGTFYVGVSDKILRGAEGTLTANPEGADIKIDFKLELGDINKEIKIEEPAGAEEFDPMMLLGGGAMMDPSMMDPSMMDPSMMNPGDMDFSEYVDASDYEPYEYEAEMLEIE